MEGVGDSIGWTRRRWVIAGSVFLGTVAYSLYCYPKLPDVMATHFDASGRPNGWMSKNTGAFLAIYGQIVCIVIWALISWFGATPERAVGTSRFSRRLSRLTPEQYRRLMPMMNVFIDGIMLAMIALFAYLQYATSSLAMGMKADIYVIPHLLIIFIIGWAVIFSVIMTVMSARVKRQLPGDK